MVDGKLKHFAMMNLNILFTLMLCVALEKNKAAFIALAYVLACQELNQSPTMNNAKWRIS
jgi:hypothetical protein